MKKDLSYLCTNTEDCAELFEAFKVIDPNCRFTSADDMSAHLAVPANIELIKIMAGVIDKMRAMQYAL
jgi:hypothetical protein